MTTQDIAIKRTMYELGFAKELFEANAEDYERFDIELRFALERNSVNHYEQLPLSLSIM